MCANHDAYKDGPPCCGCNYGERPCNCLCHRTSVVVENMTNYDPQTSIYNKALDDAIKAITSIPYYYKESVREIEKLKK